MSIPTNTIPGDMVPFDFGSWSWTEEPTGKLRQFADCPGAPVRLQQEWIVMRSDKGATKTEWRDVPIVFSRV